MKRGCDLLILVFSIKIKRSQRAAAPAGFHSFDSQMLALVMAISFKQRPNQLLPNDLYTHMVTKLFTGTA